MISALARRLRRTAADDAGFTIIEVMVAMMVFALISVGVAYGITNALVLTQDSRSRQVAVNLASQDIDRLRARVQTDGDAILDVTASTDSARVGGQSFSIKRSVAWVSSDGTSGACGTGSGTLAYKSITETVTWRTKSNPQSITMDTLLAPTANINDDTKGTIIVSATDAAGAGAAGLTVKVTPNAGTGATALALQPDMTDAQGCSYALRVTPGTYTVTVTRAGGIDAKSETAQTSVGTNSNVQVSAATNAAITYTYDTAATFKLQYTTLQSAPTAVVATNMTETMWNKLGTYTPSVSPASTSVSPVVSAFPFKDGYRGYAGPYINTTAGGTATCVDPNPATWTTPAPDGAVGQDVIPTSVNPGDTNVPVRIPVGVVTLNGLKANQYVTAVTASAAPGDPGCQNAQTLTFPVTTGTSQVIALPFGTWTLYSGARSGSTTTNLVAANASNVVPNTRGSVNQQSVLGLVSWANTVTLDPRQVPGS